MRRRLARRMALVASDDAPNEGTSKMAWTREQMAERAARELRDAVRDALSTHSHLNIMLINVTVEDLHGHNTAEEMP